MAENDTVGKERRPYRSSARAAKVQATRARIIAAARAEFVALGYAATTVPAIAAAAGVSARTVETTMGAKRDLLRTVVDVALAGDDEPIPVQDREWVRRAQAATAVGEAIDIIAAGVRATAERVADIFAVVHQASDADPGIAELAREFDRQRLVGAQGIVSRLAALTRLPHDIDFAVSTMWVAMDPVVYRRLLRDRGWTADEYQHWLAQTMRRSVTPTRPDAT